ARYGLYQAFKDKDQLYYATLKHYRRKIRDRFIAPFCPQRTGKKPDLNTLIHIFNLMIDNMDKDSSRSCFAHQAAIERASEDPKVKEIVGGFFDEIKDGYRFTIENSIKLGQVRNLPVEDLVLYVIGIERALVAMVKQNCSIEECKDYLRCSLVLLQPDAAFKSTAKSTAISTAISTTSAS
ncbi:MAG: hypothetical protein KTR16_03665, partial [Acidiferrobacterales bacterium]|nr:hypothetical protein [Acidiferrobacterales bacterium]